MRSLYEKKELCFGCGACVANCPNRAIKMEADEEGFMYPVLEQDKCIDCDKCLKVCPAQREKKVFSNSCYYGFQISDQEILRQSASGGAFSGLAGVFFKERSGINSECVVYGASMGENGSVYHKAVKSEEELKELRNSKYVESILDECFCEIPSLLEKGSHVLFSGTPCQVQGLKNVLDEHPGNALWDDKVLLVEIICNGVGSPLVWKGYRRELEKKAGQAVHSYTFRDKRAPRGYAVSWRLSDGSEFAEGLLKNKYWSMYQKGLISRPSCYSCPYTRLERGADVTIGDFHGLEDAEGVFDIEAGVSLVIANTEKGRVICRKLEELGVMKEYSVQEILQPRLQKPATRHPLRKIFLKDMSTMPYELFAKKYGVIWGDKKG